MTDSSPIEETKKSPEFGIWLVPDKQPGAGEDAFQFLLVNLVVYEDLAADLPRYQIDEPGTIT
jgi:hypothetical protein